MKNPNLPDMSDVLHLMSDVFTQNFGQIVRHLPFVDANRLDIRKRVRGGGQVSYTFPLRITCKKGRGGPESM